MPKTRKELIGYIGVDSGTVIISDPCYMIDDGWSEDDYQKEVVDKSSEMTRQIVFPDVGSYKGVLSEAGFGDGVYPVYAKISDEGEWGDRVKEISIKFF